MKKTILTTKQFEYHNIGRIERAANRDPYYTAVDSIKFKTNEWLLGERVITSIVNHFINKYNIDFTQLDTIDISNVNTNKDNIIKDILKTLKKYNADFQQVYPIIYLLRSVGIDWVEFTIIEKSFDPIIEFTNNIYDLVIEFD